MQRVRRREPYRLFLASTSVAALLVGGSSAPARATACLSSYTNQAVSTNCSNSGTLSGISLDNSTIPGVTNAGTLAPNGIILQNGSAIEGQLVDSGTIAGGISIDATSSIIAPSSQAIHVTGPTFAGGIINRGLLVGSQTAVEIFTTSTFTGGISNAGTITASNLGAISVESVTTFAGGISNSGIITVSGTGGGISVTAGQTFSGGIANSGSMKVAATGILLASVTNFSGGIVNSAGGTISAGLIGIEVQNVTSFAGGMSNAGTITAKTGIVVGSGVTFAPGSAIVNTGVITGTGGTAIDVSGATSAMTIDQNAGNISGLIKLSSNADTLNISGGSIAGSILGHGTSDTINFNVGSGTFIYGAAYSFTGINAVNVNSGTAILNGENNASTVTVNGGNLQIGDAADPSAILLANTAVNVGAGGTLSGYGTVEAPVTIASGGTLSPGGTIGTLTIAGSLAFSAGSTYGIELSPTQHSSTVVNGVPGTVTISGGNVVLSPHLGTYSPSTFAILTSTGTLTGTFNAAIEYSGAFKLNGAALTYDAHDVYLSYGQTTNTLQPPPGATINQQNVANGINNFILGGGPPPASLQNLGTLTGGALAISLNQIDGEAGTGAERATFQLTDEFLELMLDPFVNGRGFAPAGGGGTGGALGFAPEVQASLPPDVALAYASILGKAPAKPSFAQRWSAWGAAYGGSNDAQGNAAVGSSNVTASTYGFAAGLDYQLSPNTVVGFALAGAGTNWGLADALGTGRSNALQVGTYGISWFGPAYLAGALSFSNQWFSTNRSALGAPLSASFVGQGYGARLEGGYRVRILPTLAVTPYAAVQFQDFNTPSYSESDPTGSGLGLTYAAMNATDVRTELGSRFDAPTLFYGKPLVLYGRIAWAHDFVSNPALSATFGLLPGSNFTVYGAPIAHDSALTTAGAQLFLSSHWSLLAKFDGDFAPGSQTYAGSGTLRYIW